MRRKRSLRDGLFGPGLVTILAATLIMASTSQAGFRVWMAFSQPSEAPVVTTAELTVDRATGLRMVDGKPFTGVAISTFTNGNPASEERFESGRRQGALRRWFQEGGLAFESYYEVGRREGVTTSWWRNGNLRTRTTYVNDRPDGVAWSWYRDGMKFKRFQYSNGRPTGLQQGWRKNGKLFSNFEYRNGRTYGLRNSNLCLELEDEQFVASNGS